MPRRSRPSASTTASPSRGEGRPVQVYFRARKTIKSGGVYLNNNRVTDEEQTLGQDDFLHGRFALIRRGKKALGVVEKH